MRGMLFFWKLEVRWLWKGRWEKKMGLTIYMPLSCQAYQFYEKYVYIELRIYYKLGRSIWQLIVEEDFIAKRIYLPLAVFLHLMVCIPVWRLLFYGSASWPVGWIHLESCNEVDPQLSTTKEEIFQNFWLGSTTTETASLV